MTTTRTRALALLAAIVLAAPGCPMILGVDDLETVDPGDAGASSSASSEGGGASGPGSGGAGASGGSSSGGAGGSGGGCDQDCLGGQCLEGACQPVQVVGGQLGIRGVAATNDGTVYWTTSEGHVRKCAVGKCKDTMTTFWDDQDEASGIAVVLPWLYWVVPGDVRSCDVSTGCASYVLEPTDADGGVTVDAALENVYWSSAGTSQLHRCMHNFCSPEEFLGGTPGPGGITVAQPFVYWTTWDGTKGQIHRCKTPGCTREATVVSGPSRLGGVAVDATHLYWTDSKLNTVRRCLLSDCGGTTEDLATDQATPTGIALDDVSVYWVSEVNVGIWRLAK